MLKDLAQLAAGLCRFYTPFLETPTAFAAILFRRVNMKGWAQRFQG